MWNKISKDIVTTGSGGYNFIKLDAGMTEVGLKSWHVGTLGVKN